MGVVQRQAIKSTLYIYAGVIIGFVTSALIFPTYLTKTQIGVVTLLTSWGSIFAQFATLGFIGTALKFFPVFRNKEHNHYGFLFLQLAVMVAGFLAFLGLFFILKPWILRSSGADSAFGDYLWLVIPYTGFQLFFLTTDAYNRALYNASTGTLLREFVLRLLVLLSVAFFVLGWYSYHQFVWLYVLSYGVIGILMVVFLQWKNEFRPTPNFSKLDPGMARDMGSLSAVSFLTGFGTIAIMRIDSIMLDFLKDADAVGVYAIMFSFATMVYLPSRALRGIAPTLIAQALEENRWDTIAAIYQKSTITQLIAGLYVLLGIWTNIDNVFHIVPETYREGQYVILFIGLSNVVKMAGENSDMIINYSKHYRWSILIMILWLIMIVLTNYWLIPVLGVSGAALASLISVAAITLTRFLFLLFAFRLQPYRWAHFLAIVAAIVTYAVVQFIPPVAPFLLDIGMRAMVTSLLYLPAIYWLKLSPEINQIIARVVKR